MAEAPVERNRRIAREFFDALSRADVAKLDELYAEDFELWTPGSFSLSGTRQRAEALEGMRLVGSMFPDGLRFAIRATTVEGDRVAVEAESDGVHASGRRYHNRYHFLLVIRDGKIHRVSEYMDTMHAHDVLMQEPASDGAGP